MTGREAAHRAAKGKSGGGERQPEKQPARSAPAVHRASAEPSRTAAPTSPAFALSGVQREVSIGAANDPMEREADQVSRTVTGGGSVDPGTISRMTTTPRAGARRAAPATSEPAPASGRKPAQKTASAGGETKKPDQPVMKAEAEKPKPPATVQKEDKAKSPHKQEPATIGAVQAAAEPAPAPKSTAGGTAVQKAAASGAGQSGKPAEPKPVQRTAVPEATGETSSEDIVQTAADGGGGGGGAAAGSAPGGAPAAASAPASASMEAVAGNAIANRGPGTPLAAGTRGALESRMGVDLGDVRVHDDSADQAAAEALDARAFTHGNDIWLARGESQTDLGLMAHEATHVVQQDGAAHRQHVQRGNGSGGSSGGGGTGTGTGPAIEVVHQPTKTITFPTIELPGAAGKAASVQPPPLTIPKQPVERTDQRQKWLTEISGPGVSTKVDEKLPDRLGLPPPTTEGASVPSSERIFYLKLKQQGSFLIGRRESLKERLKLPNWSESGSNARFDVDHVRELQLGGQDQTSNYQLLDFSANRSSGSRIKNEIKGRIESAVRQEEAADRPWPGSKDWKDIRSNYEITFRNINQTLQIIGQPELRYSYDDVAQTGKHLDGLDVLTAAQVQQYNIRGGRGRLIVYTAGGAGSPKSLMLSGNGPTYPMNRQNWERIQGFDLKSVTYQPGVGGSITGDVFSRNRAIAGGELTVDLDEIEGLPYTTQVRASTVRARMRNLLHAKQASPIEVHDADLTDAGVGIGGALHPTLPFLGEGLEIDIAVLGDDVTLSATLSAGDFSFPGPIRVTAGSLTLSAGTSGLALEGEIQIEIENVATGSIRGRVGSDGGLELTGTLNFDTNLFSPAEVSVGYRRDASGAGAFSGHGTLEIPEGRLQGIRSAQITASYEGGVFTATGSVQPEIPGVQQADLIVSYSEEQGLTIGGTLQLSDSVPGIRGGSIEAEVRKPPGGDEYQVTATGTAQPDIPGIDTTLTIAYDNGAITAQTTASYERGMLSGTMEVGATNRVVDENGELTDTIGDELRAFGGGELTIRITPWLQGTVGVRILPVGELELHGEIALPDSVEIFARRQIERSLGPPIAVQVPIFPGIVAEVGGGLSAEAGIGPGAIDEMRLGITYNPSHEEDTHITGDAHLNIPADAGLRLAVRAGIGLGITGASATGGLEIGGMLGLAGAAEAGVHVDWTPTSGLSIDAFGELHAEVVFRFDIAGYVSVRALGFAIYDQSWQLAAYEFGSNLRFGVRFPIKYVEDEPFEISLDDVEFQVPDVDPQAILSGLISRIA